MLQNTETISEQNYEVYVPFVLCFNLSQSDHK